MIIRKLNIDGFDKTTFRNKVTEVQKKIVATNMALIGHDADIYCPLKHSFGDNVYVREIVMPVGTFIISKIHKLAHPYFVMKGKVSVATEDGVKIIEAPFQGMTPAGTKRALYIHEETTWITVHVTSKTNLDEIEEEILAKDYKEFESFINKNILDIEGV